MTFDWRNADDEDIERHFNPRVAVADALEQIASFPQRSAAARETLNAHYDIRFGERPKETLDLFLPAGADRSGAVPAQIFIHGGYWRALDKSDHSFVAAATVAAGAAHISLNYDLCPEVTLDTIVDEMRNAVRYIVLNAHTLGVDRKRLVIGGHSAGAHLAAMMLRQDWASDGLPADPFFGLAQISGIYEPEAVMHTSVNDDVQLTQEMARRNDAIAEPPLSRAPVLIAVGGDEPEGWRRQSADYAATCRGAGLEVEEMVVPGTHHFTVLAASCDASAPLFQRQMAQLGL